MWFKKKDKEDEIECFVLKKIALNFSQFISKASKVTKFMFSIFFAVCSYTYNRICALRIDYCAQRSNTTGKDAILTYDQQMFTSDDLQNNNFVDGKYRAPKTGEYSVNFFTKGFTTDGKLELYHNDKKVEWDQEIVNDHYQGVLDNPIFHL